MYAHFTQKQSQSAKLVIPIEVPVRLTAAGGCIDFRNITWKNHPPEINVELYWFHFLSFIASFALFDHAIPITTVVEFEMPW